LGAARRSAFPRQLVQKPGPRASPGRRIGAGELSSVTRERDASGELSGDSAIKPGATIAISVAEHIALQVLADALGAMRREQMMATANPPAFLYVLDIEVPFVGSVITLATLSHGHCKNVAMAWNSSSDQDRRSAASTASSSVRRWPSSRPRANSGPSLTRIGAA